MKPERWIAGLCLLAAARVLFGCAALPFFNNVDEQIHFDLVWKYSRGHVPSHIGRLDPEAAKIIAFAGTPEFFHPPEAFEGGKMPPPIWEQSPEDAARAFGGRFSVWRDQSNLESNYPPVYYMAAGLWLRLADLAGLGEVQSLYWIRFLNGAIVAALVWIAWYFMRLLYPSSSLYQFGLPLLVAVFPQDVVYGINPDVLSPLVFGAAFYLTLRCAFLPTKSAWPYAAAGLLAALAVLVKWTNLAILPLYLVALPKIFSRRGDRRRGIALIAAALIPVASWSLWKYSSLREWTGDLEKVRQMGWTPRNHWFAHPIFHPSGAAYFLSSFLKTFWRGELIWHGRRLFEGPWDYFFIASTVVFLSAAVWSLRKERDPKERAALVAAFACFAAFLTGLAWTSVRFDFGSTIYPSRVEPFLYSGRLAFGCLLPFLQLYLYGFQSCTMRLSDRARLGIVGTLCVFILAGTVVPFSRVAPSRYNLFHLVQASR